MDEYQAVLEKLRKIEALFAGAATPGERSAAEAARERIRERLRGLQQSERAEEWRFSLDNPWSRKLFVALARRYGLKPYRRYGQRRTTVMVSAPRGFVDDTLLPEFKELNRVLLDHLDSLAAEIIERSIASDTSDPEEVHAALMPSG